MIQFRSEFWMLCCWRLILRDCHILQISEFNVIIFVYNLYIYVYNLYITTFTFRQKSEKLGISYLYVGCGWEVGGVVDGFTISTQALFLQFLLLFKSLIKLTFQMIPIFPKLIPPTKYCAAFDPVDVSDQYQMRIIQANDANSFMSCKSLL